MYPNHICDMMSSTLLLLWHSLISLKFICMLWYCQPLLSLSQHLCHFPLISDLTIHLISALLYVTAIDICSCLVALFAYLSAISLLSSPIRAGPKYLHNCSLYPLLSSMWYLPYYILSGFWLVMFNADQCTTGIWVLYSVWHLVSSSMLYRWPIAHLYILINYH